MGRFTVIVTMAGLGTRFKRAGYISPKYMVEVKGRTLFEWSMESLADYASHADRFVFIVQRANHAGEFIKERSRGIVSGEISIVELDGATDGQATTCLGALGMCAPEDPIMVYNIDTYVERDNLRYSAIAGDGYIPCFKASGDHWSFVRTSPEGYAVEVAEKRRISSNCSIGAYYFSSAGLFKDAYESLYLNNRYAGMKERYVAPMYNELIKIGKLVTIDMIDFSAVHVLGTPEEVERFKNTSKD